MAIVEGNNTVVVYEELSQRKVETPAIRLGQTFFRSPIMIKGLQGSCARDDGRPFFGRELFFEIPDRDVFDLFQIDAYFSMSCYDTGGSSPGMGNIEIGAVGQERSSIFRVVQACQGRRPSVFCQRRHQQQLSKKGAIGILPVMVTPNLSCRIGGKKRKQGVEGFRRQLVRVPDGVYTDAHSINLVFSRPSPQLGSVKCPFRGNNAGILLYAVPGA